MRKFEISTDSTADLYADEYKQLEVAVAPLEYNITTNDELVVELDNYQKYEDYTNFYNRLKAKSVAKTSILSLQAHIDLFESMAKKGIKKAVTGTAF